MKMKLGKSVALLAALASITIAVSSTWAQTESTDNPMADDIFGDLPPAEPMPGEKAPNTKSVPAAPVSEPAITDTMPVEQELAPAEAPVVDLTPMKNPAFDRLDAFKMTRAELAAFMKAGGLKSRVMKEAK